MNYSPRAADSWRAPSVLRPIKGNVIMRERDVRDACNSACNWIKRMMISAFKPIIRVVTNSTPREQTLTTETRPPYPGPPPPDAVAQVLVAKDGKNENLLDEVKSACWGRVMKVNEFEKDNLCNPLQKAPSSREWNEILVCTMERADLLQIEVSK